MMLDVEKDCDLVEAHMDFLQMHIRRFCLRCEQKTCERIDTMFIYRWRRSRVHIS